jgi:hypothetical protein
LFVESFGKVHAMLHLPFAENEAQLLSGILLKLLVGAD